MQTENAGLKVQKLPAMLHFLQECTHAEQFLKQAEIDDSAIYSVTRHMNLLEDGMPLYCQRTKLPPTTISTPGHTIPAGYTPSGKYKPTGFSPPKLDKRVGK
jgi:hypothetical protein